MGKALAHFKTEDFSVPSSDGETSLFVRRYSRGEPRMHFLLVHGALEHSGRHLDLINFWMKSYHDVTVTVYDHIGHGRSGGVRTFVPSFKVYVEDLLRVGEFVAQKSSSDTRHFICAHSLGGLITLTRLLDATYGWKFPLSGVLLSNPCVRAQSALGASADALIEPMNRFVPYLHLPMIYKGIDLTRDIHAANDFDTDTLISKFITVRMVREIFEASTKVRGLSYYMTVPSLFLVSGDGRIVDPESTILFAHGIDKKITTIIQYPDHRHDIWNEIDRQDIFQTMKNWVDKQLKENP